MKSSRSARSVFRYGEPRMVEREQKRRATIPRAGAGIAATFQRSFSAIDLKLGADVNAIDVRSREVALDDGSRLAFDHLLLATGSEPVRPSIPGADQPQVHTLRQGCERI